ncbi:PspC domain-containing protein [Xylanimonas protaetiae]|uniref:PspC domain-containing protein n=1 Tax=Xylanimonas protaetiae TaxID=2509457 RepID=A0A4P6F2T9_9MICO|nr:PspC domain-containing protein [Xylanimonas protaetiae]QAY70160.1 PspC domain-containing protein [Xylanimonas protaetiae]
MPPPPGTPPYDPNRGSGQDRFFDSIRRTGLYRTEDRWVGGVAGGLAARLGWDPLLVRGLLFLSFFLTGIGLVAYAIGWALLPEQRDGRIHLQQAFRGDFNGALVGAAVALIVGLNRADGTWWNGGWGGWGWIVTLFWIAVWVTIGWLLVRYLRDRRRNRGAAGGGAAGYPPYPTQPGGAPYAAPASSSASAADAGGYAASSTPSEGVTSPVPPTTPYAPFAAAVPPTQAAQPTSSTSSYHHGNAAQARVTAANARAEAARARAAASREEAQARAFAARQRAEARAAERASRPVTKSAGAGTVGVVFGLMLVAGALLAAADRTGFRFPSPFDGSYDAALLWVGVSLVIVGAAVVVSGIRGRSSGWLGFLAIVGLVVALPWSVTAGNDDFRGLRITSDDDAWVGVRNGIDVSEGTVTPRSVAEAERGFRAQFGDPTIDLSGLDLSGATVDDPVEVPIRLTAGDLTVVVPRDIAVEADVRLLAGQVVWRVDPDERTLSRVGSSTARLRSDEAADDGAILRLLVSAGAGNVTVEEG